MRCHGRLMIQPVDWRTDPNRRAVLIHCAVCRVCRWRNPKRSAVCLYGGPFDGYNEPQQQAADCLPTETL